MSTNGGVKKSVSGFLARKAKTKKCSFIWVVFIIALPLPTSKWNGRCWSLMAGSLLDPRVINNKTLLSVTGGSVVIQMTGIKRWFYLLGIRNISIINSHQQQQQQSVWREDLLLLHSAVKSGPASVSDSQFFTMSHS